MLHIPFAELPRRSTQQLFARQRWFRMYQRHHILQLVPEAKCAAGLIKAGTGP